MKHIALLILAGTLLAACSTQKPEPTSTQIVNGQSIVIPPEFDQIPHIPATDEKTGETK